MNHHLNYLRKQVTLAERRVAKELGITHAQYNVLEFGYSNRVKARRGAARLAERTAANKAGFLTVKAWKYHTSKK